MNAGLVLWLVVGTLAISGTTGWQGYRLGSAARVAAHNA